MVRTVPYGESDVVATALTLAEGKVALMVRGARRGARRVGGAMEPFHTVRLAYDDQGGEVSPLREAEIVRVRAGILGRLEAVEAAGVALRWVRHLCPPRTPEPSAYATLVAFLDALDDPSTDPRRELAAASLRLLSDVGYALEFERCVRCGKPCPQDRPGAFDPARGGLVCRACGGAGRVVSAELRAMAVRLQAGEGGELTSSQADAMIALVDAAMAAHAGFDPSTGRA